MIIILKLIVDKINRILLKNNKKIMSSAGHILDMIQRMKQNRLLQRSKREQIRDIRDRLYEKKTSLHVPETHHERINPARWIKYFKGFVFICIVCLILFFIYLILL